MVVTFEGVIYWLGGHRRSRPLKHWQCLFPDLGGGSIGVCFMVIVLPILLWFRTSLNFCCIAQLQKQFKNIWWKPYYMSSLLTQFPILFIRALHIQVLSGSLFSPSCIPSFNQIILFRDFVLFQLLCLNDHPLPLTPSPPIEFTPLF